MIRFVCFLLLLCSLVGGQACRSSRKAAKSAPAKRPATAATTPKKPAPASPAPATPAPRPTEAVADAPLYTTPAPPKREFRAVWIATVDNIDWPSRKGLPSDVQQAEFRTMLDEYYQTGMNAVVVQVRAAADAFYAKSPEPWSEWLTGQQGLAPNPFYDPLEFMIDEAHNRGMEFHAWLNLDRATFSKTASVTPTNIAFQRPNWMVEYGGRKLFNLGMPEVRAYVAGVVANLVRNYDIDGIHFDDYFYPYAVAGQTFSDDHTYRASGSILPKADWRRSNVDQLIRQLGDSIQAIKPYVKFGISPFGIWKNRSSDPEGSATNGGQSYYELYADSRKWAREGWIDYIAPQVYFSTGFERVPYRVLVDWWTQNSGKRHLYIGHGAYRIGKGGARDSAWQQPAQLPLQIRHNRQRTPVHGSIFFSAKSLRSNPYGVRDSLATNLYRYPALVPTMPWKDSLAPLAPHDLKAAAVEDGIELFWQAPEPAADGDRAHYYVVYRFEGRNPDCRTDDPRHIVAICRGESTTRFVDRSTAKGKRYTYIVTAFDRLHNESEGATLRHHGL